MSETYGKYRVSAPSRRTIDGIVFHSKKEADRYKELKLLLAGKAISQLKLQVPFDLVVNKQKICRYLADFTYHENGKIIVEDCKGCITDVYRLKRKLMFACLGITIRET